MKAIAVDIGGTWIRAGLVKHDGTCTQFLRCPTHRKRPPFEIIKDISDIVSKVSQNSGHDIKKMCGISIGVPTRITDNGKLLPSNNLPTMSYFPFLSELRKRLKVPIFLTNDAICFALGEWWKGAGKKTKVFCGITLGTGIGLGIIIDGHAYPGTHGYAGEIWKSPMYDKTVEDFICGSGLEYLYGKYTGKSADACQIISMALDKDKDAYYVLGKFGTMLGEVLSYLVNIIDPEIIAFGGSIASAFPFFIDSLSDVIRRNTVSGKSVILKQSVLGELSPLIGAGKIIWETKK